MRDVQLYAPALERHRSPAKCAGFDLRSQCRCRRRPAGAQAQVCSQARLQLQATNTPWSTAHTAVRIARRYNQLHPRLKVKCAAAARRVCPGMYMHT